MKCDRVALGCWMLIVVELVVAIASLLVIFGLWRP